MSPTYRAVVTGGASFIGSLLVDALLGQGHKVVGRLIEFKPQELLRDQGLYAAMAVIQGVRN